MSQEQKEIKEATQMSNTVLIRKITQESLRPIVIEYFFHQPESKVKWTSSKQKLTNLNNNCNLSQTSTKDKLKLKTNSRNTSHQSMTSKIKSKHW